MSRVRTMEDQLRLPHSADGAGATNCVEVEVVEESGMGVLLMKPSVVKRHPSRRLLLPPGASAGANGSDAGRRPEATLVHRESSPGSLCAPLRQALIQGLDALQRDSRCRYIVIASSSPHVFSLGLDTFQFAEGVSESPTVQDLCEAIVRCNKPTVSAVYGKCFSWGLEMALCTTYRVAVEGRSWFGFPEVRLAMIPASVLGIQALIKRAGVRSAVRLLSTGKVLSSVEVSRTPPKGCFYYGGLVDALWKVPEAEEEEEQAEGRGHSVTVYRRYLAFLATFMEEKMKKDAAQRVSPRETPYNDPITRSLVPYSETQRAGTWTEGLQSLPNEAVLWTQVRMFCAWAIHEISISPLPRRIKSPYYMVESIRIATIRFSPEQHRQQLARFFAFVLKCTNLPESLAVQHTYKCIEQQHRWVPFVAPRTNEWIPRPLPSSSSPTSEWKPPQHINTVSIIAEDHASAAYLAAMFLHSKPYLQVVILCLRPYLSNRRRRRRRRSSSPPTDDESSSSSSDDENDGSSGRRGAGNGATQRQISEEQQANQVRYRNIEELRSTVMDYVWLFREANQPGNGPESRSGLALRTQLSAQLRIIDVRREHANGGWYNVPKAFYEADMLFECAYPWTTITSSSSLAYYDTIARSATQGTAMSLSRHRHGSSPSADALKRALERGMIEQRLRRWAYLDASMKLECVFVCTTASTDMNTMSYPILRHRDRLLGAFFAPRIENHAGVVEVCHTRYTSPDVLRFVLYIFQQLSCYTAVVRSPICGFVLCRMLFSGLYQAHSMLLDGCFPIELERAMRRRLQCKASLLRIEDILGLDWCVAVREAVSRADLPRRDVEAIPRRMIQRGHVGRRTGEGWFRYDKLKGREYYSMNPQHTPLNAVSYACTSSSPLSPAVMVNKLLERGSKAAAALAPSSVLPLYAWPAVKVQHSRTVEREYVSYCKAGNLFRRDVTDIEMTERMCLAVVHEAVRLLSDGVVGSSKDVDLMSIYALGFPVFTGGVLFEADQFGDPKSLLYKLRLYARALGESVFPSPCRAIIQMASDDLLIGQMFP